MRDITMQRYGKFQPTGFDAMGLNAEYHGIGEFYVSPVSRNRDSGDLDESNFDTFLKALGGESETVQVHRFGHWANGWFELILIDPADTTAVEHAQEMSDTLEDYPVLDDEDYSRREWQTVTSAWEHASIRERIYWLAKARQNIFAARRDEFPEDSNGSLYDCLRSN